MHSRVPYLPALALAFTALLLAGCGTPVAPQCPVPAFLADTASLTLFRPGAARDPSGVAYTADFTKLDTSCHFDKDSGLSDTSINLTIRAVRPPSADGATVSVPYYIAVTQGERILSKRNLTATITFAPGVATVDQPVFPDNEDFNLEFGHPATDYQLLIGFQLNDDQRAYNQMKKRFAP